jgi:hypothetical protein
MWRFQQVPEAMGTALIKAVLPQRRLLPVRTNSDLPRLSQMSSRLKKHKRGQAMYKAQVFAIFLCVHAAYTLHSNFSNNHLTLI